MDPSTWYDSQTQQYYPYGHLPPNPNTIAASATAPAPTPVSSHTCEPPHTAGDVVQPPGVDAAHAYPPHGGYDGHAVSFVYPAAGAGTYYHGYAGGGAAQSVLAEDASRQYGVHPNAHGDVLGRTPSVSIYQNKASRLKNGIIWKKKKKIPKVMQHAYCEACKITCNSQEVLNSHKQGKKHKKNVEKLKEALAPNPAKALMKAVENKETLESDKDRTVGEKKKKNPSPATEIDLEMKTKKVLQGGAAADAVKVCTLCNVVCNSQVVYNFHLAGQKHAAMVKQQQGAAVSQT